MPRLFKTTRTQREEFRLLGEASSIGWFFAAAIAIGYGIGYWVDHRYGTAPWGIVIGAGIGAGAAFKHVIEIAGRLAKSDEKRRRDREDPKP